MRTAALSLFLLLALAPDVFCQQSDKTHQRVFLIGNSLTWDTMPSRLGEGVEWHVDCGKNLKFIYENPKSPCVQTSVLWPEALKTRKYDVLCVQPHFGSSLQEDVSVISAWLDLQPEATLVIHTGWNRSADFAATYSAEIDHDQMVHHPSYFNKLTEALQKKYPDREIRSTEAIQMLAEIHQDIARGEAPFDQFEDLYRDAIHLGLDSGRYLMHNVLRITLGMEMSDEGFQIEPTHQAYFDRKLDAFQSKRAK